MREMVQFSVWDLIDCQHLPRFVIWLLLLLSCRWFHFGDHVDGSVTCNGGGVAYIVDCLAEFTLFGFFWLLVNFSIAVAKDFGWMK